MATKTTHVSRMGEIIEVWARMECIETQHLASEWQCSSSTVSRFLRGKAMPDGPTMGRIISWLMASGDAGPQIRLEVPA